MTASSIIIGVGTAIVMAYSGLLFDPALMRQYLSRRSLPRLGRLAIVNFLIIPVATLGLIRLMPTLPDLNLVLLTLAVMPCAPLVPALVSMVNEPPEWPLFVFLAFSLLSILFIPLLMAVLPQPWAAGNLAHADSVNGVQMLLYLLTGYIPLLLGIVLRLFDNTRGLRLLGLLKPGIPVASVVAMTLVVVEHWQDVTGVTIREIVLMTIFVLGCALIGLALGPRSRAAPMTNILPSAFRNITLALAFCNTVFAHTKAMSYLFAVTVVMLLLIFAAVWGLKKMAARAVLVSHEVR